MQTYSFHPAKQLLVTAVVLACIALCLSCGSDSTMGPDNGDTDPADMIIGRILGDKGDPCAGISTTVSYNDTSYMVTCDDEGYFTIPMPAPDQRVTLIPIQQSLYSQFIPPAITFTGKPDKELLFISVHVEADNAQIIGKVTDNNGISVDTAINIITSDATYTSETTGNGVFHCLLPESESVTVTPESDVRFAYEPESYTFDTLNNGDNVSCIFTATPSTELYSIFCTATGFLNTENIHLVVIVDGVRMEFRSNSFVLKHLLPGEHSIEITDARYQFAPSTVTINITDSDVYLTDITATYSGATEYAVSGCVDSENGDGIEGITIEYYLMEHNQWTPEKFITRTYEEGKYVLNCFSDNDGDMECIIIPQNEGYTFEPDTLTVNIPYVYGTKNGGVITAPDIIATDYTASPARFFPLDEGTEWTYSVTDSEEYVINIDGTETAGDFAYSRFTPTGPGGMGLLRIYGGDVHAWDGDEDIVLLRFGVVPGTEWVSGHDSAGYERTGVFHGLADVTVPAGTLGDCLRFESRLNYGKTSYESYEMWFAEGVGLVQQVRTLVNYGDEIERTEMELAE